MSSVPENLSGAALQTLLGATTATASVTYFRSPTGRIHCFIGRFANVRSAACYNALTIRITAPGNDCGSNASVLEVRPKGRARLECVGNAFPRGRKLAYGRSISYGSLRCTSRFRA